MSHAAAVPNARARVLRLGMWLFLASEVMMFGGFLASYIIFRTANPAMALDQAHLDRTLATVNTLILIGSSFTMALAVEAAEQRQVRKLRGFLLLTILLGVTFLGIKGVEYAGKFHHGIASWTSLFFSCYFTMTGLHGVHVIGGLVVMGILAARAERLVDAGSAAVESAGLYWHFVDVVWIFLFPILYLL
jgi:heme/copper-type cytochrome/quinol oxidase subunit 3